jgi:hypothetical protein
MNGERETEREKDKEKDSERRETLIVLIPL